MRDPDLDDLLAAGRAAWPDVELSREELSEFAAHIEDSRAHAADIYLAAGCAAGKPQALAAFERHCMADVAGFVTHVERAPAFVDELKQVLRMKLFVGGDRPPKIRDYAGRGSLGGWLRIAAVRTALNMRRSPATPAPIAVEPTGDPELDYLKVRYREEFRAVVDATFASLTRDERTLLRMHYFDGLTIDDLAAVFEVHRATVARWIARSREAILERARALFEERHQLHGSELDSLMRLVGSQLDVSIHRLLQTPVAGE